LISSKRRLHGAQVWIQMIASFTTSPLSKQAAMQVSLKITTLLVIHQKLGKLLVDIERARVIYSVKQRAVFCRVTIQNLRLDHRYFMLAM
jgi:hypothetical protein